MNCDNVAAILDDHAWTRLSAVERCALEEHVTGCEPCGFAWHAQSALLALPVPATAPARLLHRALRSVGAQVAPRRRMRAHVVIVTAMLAAGAALAAVTALKLLESSTEPLAVPATSIDAPVSATSGVPAKPTTGPNADVSAYAGPVDIEYIDVEPFMVERTAPDYPPEALKKKLNGDVTLKFTINERGVVKNLEVVRSSDSVFEAAAVAALSQWKYLPRISAGKRVAAVGVQTIIRFTLDAPNLSPARASAIAREAARTPKPDQPGYAAMQAVDRGIAVAWQRIAGDDPRGGELELDELRATYEFLPSQLDTAWLFYGYVYIEYGDYGRAIDAYENAIASSNGRGTQAWTPLAKLYFARHQYDMALKTLLAYKQSGIDRMTPEAAAMIDELRALGVTEETL